MNKYHIVTMNKFKDIRMKEILFVLLLLIVYTIIGTIEVDPAEGVFSYYYAMPELVFEEERGNDLIMTVTAYTSCPNETDDTPFLTATMDSVRVGVVAGDPSIFPFGTKFIIPGYNKGRACVMLDSGSKIKGYSLDVWMRSKEEARKWG